MSCAASIADDALSGPNVAPYMDDIYAYLQARADGVLARGHPISFGE